MGNVDRAPYDRNDERTMRRARSSAKEVWMNKYLGIVTFELRPHPGP